ncbi:c-type cytochrome [Thiocapsa imhoffii]|uniref:c-type cytochrome n=1 Tax=Thiocapsa imhoffii TaxID=382777 RepID=UPI001905EA51|nr:c-type cytochrome [Thiocapsa imhoffii]
MSPRVLTACLSVACAGVLVAAVPHAVADEEAAETARLEYEQVMALTPNIENGRQVYLTCAVCHHPEGWGTPDGAYPQIAGQWRTVVIKQLADIRARNRDNPLMYPFSVPRILGGPQNIADVAAYVASLPMNPQNGRGPGVDLELGGQVYREHCARCHGDAAEGNDEKAMPMIAGQHYHYLMRQFDAIRSGTRHNSDPKMVKQIDGFTPRHQAAVLDYVSRLRPPAEKIAQPNWMNPDFPAFVRDPMSIPPMPAMPPLPPIPPLRFEGVPEPERQRARPAPSAAAPAIVVSPELVPDPEPSPAPEPLQAE